MAGLQVGADLWGVLPTWVLVGGTSPQVPEHPTSICDAGVKQFYMFVLVLCRVWLQP